MDQIPPRHALPSGPAFEDVAPPPELDMPGPHADLPAEPPTDRLAFDPVKLRQRHGGFSPEKQREYVEALADTGIAREAAARVGLSEQAINRIRRRADAVSLDRACDAAHRFGARRLRSVAYERAIEGVLKDRYYRGELVGRERVYDNRLLTYLLGKAEPLLAVSEESRTIGDNWERCMDALEQGLDLPGLTPPLPAGAPPTDDEDDDDPQVWFEDGVRWTFFPPPEGFDGEQQGEEASEHYQRTLTAEEEAAMDARVRAQDEARLARCCAIRDSYFQLPPRGWAENFLPDGSRNDEPFETSEEEDPELGPIEYKSMHPPGRRADADSREARRSRRRRAQAEPLGRRAGEPCRAAAGSGQGRFRETRTICSPANAGARRLRPGVDRVEPKSAAARRSFEVTSPA